MRTLPTLPRLAELRQGFKLPSGVRGAVLYRGPSQLDGAPIVVVATGLRKSTDNEKTGDMVQTWILRADMLPMEAIHSGADASICGDCPHRGRVEDGRAVGRSCYVLAFQAPTAIFKAYHRGERYADATSSDARRALTAGRKVRLGSYGDPAAVPAQVWRDVLSQASHWTGYTHAPHRAPWLKGIVMASADSQAEAELLQSRGWRTFRVMTTKSDAPVSGETLCPASDESPNAQRADAKGKPRASCASCGLCQGSSRKARSVAIYVHGTPGANAAANVRRSFPSRFRKLATVAGA